MSSKDINQTSGTPSAPLSATDPSTSASAPPDSTSMASLLATTAEQGKALEGKERLVEAIEGPCDSDDEGPWRGRSLIWTARVSVKRVRAVVREEGEEWHSDVEGFSEEGGSERGSEDESAGGEQHGQDGDDDTIEEEGEDEQEISIHKFISK